MQNTSKVAAALELAKPTDRVEVVVTLSPSEPILGLDVNEVARRKWRSMIERVSEAVGYDPEFVKFFVDRHNLRIRSDAEYVLELLKQPEVADALLLDCPSKVRG